MIITTTIFHPHHRHMWLTMGGPRRPLRSSVLISETLTITPIAAAAAPMVAAEAMTADALPPPSLLLLVLVNHRRPPSSSRINTISSDNLTPTAMTSPAPPPPIPSSLLPNNNKAITKSSHKSRRSSPHSGSRRAHCPPIAPMASIPFRSTTRRESVAYRGIRFAASRSLVLWMCNQTNIHTIHSMFANLYAFYVGEILTH